MGSDEVEIKQCPQCGGGTAAAAPMCQWCGFVEPESPLGKQRAKAKFRREMWILAAVLLVVIVGAAVLVTTSYNNARDQSRDDICDIAEDNGFSNPDC